MIAHLSYRMTLGKAYHGGGACWKSLTLWEARTTGSRAHSLCILSGLHQILAVQTLKPLLRFQKHTTSPHPKPCPHAHPILAEFGEMHRVETEVMQGNSERGWRGQGPGSRQCGKQPEHSLGLQQPISQVCVPSAHGRNSKE